MRHIKRLLTFLSASLIASNGWGDTNQLPLFTRKIALRLQPVVSLPSTPALPKPVDPQKYSYQLDLADPQLPDDKSFTGLTADEEKNSFALAYDQAKKFDQSWSLWLDLTERRSEFVPLLYNHLALQNKARLAYGLLVNNKLNLIDPRVVPMMTDEEIEASRNQISRFEFTDESQMWTMSLFLSRTHSPQESLGMLNAMKTQPSTRMKMLKAVDLYKTGNLKQALLELKEIPNPKSDRFDEYMLLRARLLFQNNDLENSMQSYQKVPMESPLWPEAILEMSWTQIKAEDYAKAAGQLFSLNEHVGKKVYQPERDLFKSMSYFGLCQFGDSMKSLAVLERTLQSAPKLEKGQFMQALTGKLEKPHFVYALHLLQNPSLRHDLEFLRRLDIELQWLNQKSPSQKSTKVVTNLLAGIDRVRKVTAERIEKVAAAGNVQAQNQLAKLLKEIELLKFEIYSAAGETLRMQASGASAGDKSLKKDFDKSVTWDYSGELWDDEIGQLRSSLENACPQFASEKQSTQTVQNETQTRAPSSADAKELMKK
jgi:hypothetical protein